MLDWSFAVARFTVTIAVSSLKSHFYDVCLSPAETTVHASFVETVVLYAKKRYRNCSFFCIVVDLFSVTVVVLWYTLFSPYQQTLETDGLYSIFVFCFVVLVLFSIVVLLIFCYKWHLCRCMRLDHVFFCSHLPSCLSLLSVVVFVTLTLSSYLLVADILVFLLLHLYLTTLLAVFCFYHQLVCLSEV